jgi:hypothetical protein
MSRTIDSRYALALALAGVVAGATAGFFAGYEEHASRLAASASAPAPASASVSMPPLASDPPSASAAQDFPLPPPKDDRWPRISYAQQGEDIIVQNIFETLEVRTPSYIDIGAYHPFINSNTFLLYRLGSRGVLVEPNPRYQDMLRAGRPGDKVLPFGIGVTDQAAAKYYVIRGNGLDNTFSKAQADELVRLRGPGTIEAVLELPLRNINTVLDENFPNGGPDFFSIDIEGLDLPILQTLDFSRHRPKVFCIETSMVGTGRVDERILSLMQQKGYVVRGGTFVNTIFVDAALLARSADAGARG